MQDGINAVLDENQHHRSRWGAFVRARKALEADFRCRIADGRLQLVGLSMKPVPAESLSAVPSVWADHVEFDWAKNAIKFGKDMLLIDVTVKPAASPPEALSATETKGVRSARLDGGRRRFPMAEMVVIARTRARDASNKGEAKALIAEFKRLYRGRKVPAYRTVVDHVSEIYELAAENACPLNP
ncbi:hypothetical protein [Neoroseomonas lacus]|uniref:hypothetical protein n=1 Tax=Neoroseomonas lacus TaxID=287609 RepID=UPI001662DAE5|nr:hypothetical protein [Neoroseomonas lacus]